jgi:hypothetical protein
VSASNFGHITSQIHTQLRFFNQSFAAPSVCLRHGGDGYAANRNKVGKKSSCERKVDMVDSVKNNAVVPRHMPGLGSSPGTDLMVVPQPSAPSARTAMAGLALRQPLRNVGGPVGRRFATLPQSLPVAMSSALVVGGADLPVVAHPQDREQALTVRQAIGDRHDAARIENRPQGPVVAKPKVEVEEPPKEETHPLLLMGTSPMRQLVSGGIQRRPQIEVQEPPEATHQQRLLMPAPHAELTVGEDGVETLDISGPPAKPQLQPPAEKALITGAEVQTKHQQVAVRTKVQQQAKKLAEQVLLQRSLASELKVKNALTEQIAQQGYVVVNHLVNEYSNDDSSDSDAVSDTDSELSTVPDEAVEELSDEEILYEFDILGESHSAGVAAGAPGAPDEPSDSDDDATISASSAGSDDIGLDDVPEPDDDDAMVDEEIDVSGGDATGVGGADDPDDDDSPGVGDAQGVGAAGEAGDPETIEEVIDELVDAGFEPEVVEDLSNAVNNLSEELKQEKEDSAKTIKDLKEKIDELMERLKAGVGGADGADGAGGTGAPNKETEDAIKASNETTQLQLRLDEVTRRNKLLVMLSNFLTKMVEQFAEASKNSAQMLAKGAG